MIPHADWKPKHNPWIIALTVTLATFMEVLDTSIANVALPHIAGNLSISQDEAAWVLTSYLVANAVILPISAWLSTKFGRKRFYMRRDLRLLARVRSDGPGRVFDAETAEGYKGAERTLSVKVRRV